MESISIPGKLSYIAQVSGSNLGTEHKPTSIAEEPYQDLNATDPEGSVIKLREAIVRSAYNHFDFTSYGMALLVYRNPQHRAATYQSCGI